MATEWFYQRGDEQIGPLSTHQLKDLASTGQITRDTPIRRADMQKWVSAGSAKGLFPESATPPSPNEGQAEPLERTPSALPPSAGPPHLRKPDEELWLWCTTTGWQSPKPLSHLQQMFLAGELKPTDCVQAYDHKREEHITNLVKAADLFLPDSQAISDAVDSWSVERRGKTHGPFALRKIERRYHDHKLDDEDVLTRQGCRPLPVGAFLNPAMMADSPVSESLGDQPNSVQMVVTAIVGLGLGCLVAFFRGNYFLNGLAGAVGGAVYDALATRVPLPRLATSVTPVILLSAGLLVNSCVMLSDGSHTNYDVKRILTRLPKQLTAMPDEQYATLLTALKMRDPDAVVSALRHRDPYTLFTASELAAIKHPIRGFATSGGQYHIKGGEEAHRYALPRPVAFVSYVTVEDVENATNWPERLGAFYLTTQVNQIAGGGTIIIPEQSTTECKSIYVGPHWEDGTLQIKKICFLEQDEITHEVTCYDNKISSIVSQQYRRHGYHDARSAAMANRIMEVRPGPSWTVRAGEAVTSYHKFYRIEFSKDGTATIDRNP